MFLTPKQIHVILFVHFPPTSLCDCILLFLSQICQQRHAHNKALEGASEGPLDCWLTSFAQSLQAIVLISLDGP